MADDELAVVVSDGSTKTTRSTDIGSKHLQHTGIADARETIPTQTGATNVYTVDADPAVPLDPPTGGAHYARIRCWHSAAGTFRLYYRMDGTAPTSDGANAEGYILHGEEMPVCLATLTNFQLIGESGMTGTFTVYARFRNY